VTAIELMPVHQFVQDNTLLEKGLRNYWGYNTLGFFAPHAGYSANPTNGQQVQEFKSMVKAMHQAGIEVILDVVYNHTAEGNHLGPTLSFKGIDNPAYYRLVEDDKQYYMDYTGTGNSLNVRHPHSLQLIMDSLRYWVTEMHVDGFRFDLAAALAREFYEVDRLATFFELVQQDPIVSQVKLIAEPWDVGPGGYQVGNFPPLWTEWNGAYRDTVRDFWRGEPSLGEFASRLSGSSDLYEQSGRRPFASINFVTAHDGFTLRDLVSYNEKHNEANGEDNNDGESHNRSWNRGVEGPTKDPAVLEARARAQRNFLATLLLSQGVPMILHGDELGRTQNGNNNTYAQDSEISWVHWDRVDRPLVEFTATIARLRKAHPTFHRKRFFTGKTVRAGDGERLNDIVWLHVDGTPMEASDWEADNKAIGMYLNGNGIAGLDARGQRIVDDHFVLYFNAAHEDAEVTLPRRSTPPPGTWCSTPRGRRPGAPCTSPGRRSRSAAEHDRAPRARRARGRARPLGGRVPGRLRTGAGAHGNGEEEEEDPLTMRTPERVPTSTYRVQVTADNDLFATARLLPYLHDLGVDWVYLSPILQAEPGSDHGYDVVDPTRVDESRGGARGWRPCRPRRAGSAWACWSTSCRTTSASRRPRPTPGGQTCSSTARTRPTPRTSTWTGPRATAGSCSRARRTAATSTTGGSSPLPRWPASAWRTPSCSTPRTSRSVAGSTRGWSTDLASTTPTGCATRRATSTTSPGSPAVPTCWWRRSWSRRGPAAGLGDGRHHRVRRLGAGRPRAHRPGGRGAPRRPGDLAARRPRRLGRDGARRETPRRRHRPEPRGAPDRT
jgi:pullulanase/glycogen debranching enzyme